MHMQQLFMSIILAAAVVFVHSEEVDLTCHVCNASYYCLQGQQFDCPSNSLAAVELADTIEECVCHPGYLREGDVCNLGQPPAWYMYGNRSFCVSTRKTIEQGAKGHQDCVCVPGFAGLPAVEAVPCQECPADTYTDVHNSSACVPCPAHASHNETRRENVTACVCDPGYTGPDGGPCVACPAGTFKAEPGTAACNECGVDEYSYAAAPVCVACHANSSALPRSPGVDHCLCDPGFFPQAGLCIMCHAGRFKDTTANEPCQSCTSNTFTSTRGATECTSCLASSPYSTAYPSEGGVRCQCIAGYITATTFTVTVTAFKYVIDGMSKPILELARGQVYTFVQSDISNSNHPLEFKDSTGSSYTTGVVRTGTAGQAGAKTVITVAANAPDVLRYYCVEHGDWMGNTVSVKPYLITPTCIACPTNTFQPSQGQTSCEACDPHARSPAASVTPLACLCNAGFTDNSEHECLVCAGGTYKEAAADDAEDTELCEECPEHSFSLAQSGRRIDCLCDPGYSGPNGGPCSACAPGQFKPANGSAACEDCALHSYSDAPAATACASCAVFLSSAGGITGQPGQSSSEACFCDLLGGFAEIVRNGARACSACALGTYAAETGCRNCSGGTYTDERGLTQCKQCPGNMSSYDYPFVACQCHKGYKCDGRDLITFLTNATDCRCDECPSDTFKDFTGAASVCQVCQANSESIPASTTQDMCLCKRGYRQNGPTVCEACEAGTYSDILDSLACSICPADTYTPAALSPWDAPADCQACAVCNQATNLAYTDHYDAAREGLGCGLDQATNCQPCPASASLFRPTTASQRNKGVQSCVCDAHFYGAKGAACAACPSNQVRPDFIDAATTLADCLCAPGFEPDPGAVNLCRQCPIGTYKTYIGDHNCTACPATLTTAQTGNANASACVCAPGFAFDGDKCNICSENFVKSGFNLIQTCTACTENSFGKPGGEGPMNCTCYKGFEADANTCNGCAPGKYKNSTVNLGDALAWYLTSLIEINFARACSAGGCPATASSVYPPYSPSRVVDGNTGPDYAGLFTTDINTNPWVMIDLQRTASINRVRLYNAHVYESRLKNFEIRIGDSSTFANNSLCGSRNSNFLGYRDFTCVFTGRYVSVQMIDTDYLMLREIEVYGLTPITPLINEHLSKCSMCPLNTATNSTGTHVCAACAAGKTTDGRTGQVECVCDVGTEPGTEPGAGGACQTCRAGTYKAASTDKYANRACVNCSACAADKQVATECNSTHDITCRACQANSWSYAGKTLLDPCFCNAGYELQGQLCVACPVGKARQANANNSIMCETCAAQTFTSVSTTVSCQSCSIICPEVTITSPTINLARACSEGGCPVTNNENLHLPLWPLSAVTDGKIDQNFHHTNGDNPWTIIDLQQIRYVTWIRIYNRVGFTERLKDFNLRVGNSPTHSNNPACVLNEPGQFPDYKDFPCVLSGRYFSIDKPTKDLALREVEIYGTVVLPTNMSFVKQECNASRDVICQDCQTCPAGQYANNTCGVSYGNDRLDTQCAVCPADFYCPGGSVTQAALPCPNNGRSLPGSHAITNCTCDAGYYRSGDVCVLCPLDAYCPRGVLQPIACPAPGRTLAVGSAVRLDCHCPRTYFRDPPGDEERFNCSLCTRDDYCFNNSLYNCSDALMESAPGSGFFENCTCVNRYYNNDTRCEDCAENYFCVTGKQYACPLLEWTAGRRRQEACLCNPAFFRTQTGVCLPCESDHFCDGTDDMQHACPDRAKANGATNVSSCLCDIGYAATVPVNASTPHTCVECGSTFFKNTVSNTACTKCKRCLPEIDSVYTRIVCDQTYDASCEPCTVCHKQSDIGTANERWASQACSEFVNTVCTACTVCDYSQQWQKEPCTETLDRVCMPIQRGRICQHGEYAGNHTVVKDSECLPCAMNDTLYENQQLHYYTSAGLRYDDATSCNISCRNFSRLRDPANPVLGCVSCETGNVLFKVFVQNDFECQFSCVEGYVRRGDDCELLPLHPTTSSFWNHTLNVTHVRRVAVAGAAAFRFTVSHTSHGSFAIVVGAVEPSCDGLAPVLLHTQAACCFSGLWRVSTNNQMGLSSNAVETCSMPNPPPSLRISNSQLEFDVPDERLLELAQCVVLQNSSYGEVDCVLRVSIVDTVLLHHMSVAVPLQLRRGASLAFLSGAHTYVPLLSFHAEVQLAYMDAGRPVFLVLTDAVLLPAAGATMVSLSSGLELVHPPAEINCMRYAGRMQNSSVDVWTLHNTSKRVSTFLRAQAGTSFLKITYTLRLIEREDVDQRQRNLMSVAIWRNLSLAHAVCEAVKVVHATRIGEVLSCSGLGTAAVSTLTALQDPTETVHGELGGLTSFVARAMHEHVRNIRAETLLAAFTLPPSQQHLLHVTAMREGHLDFTDTFRTACSGDPLCHFSYVSGRGVHFMRACDAASKRQAQAWLATSLGVLDDVGHVQALCERSHKSLNTERTFLITLVNTRAFMPRRAEWHDLQNRAASPSTSKIFALFVFE